MANCMAFPKTAEEFIEQYKFTDTKQEYTNGAELIPVFRVKQMLEHYFAEGNHVPGKWIPVTERLPEGANTVLAIDREGTISSAYYVGRWHSGGDLEENAVIYWMSLPPAPTMSCNDCIFYEKECESHYQMRMIGLERDMEICEIFCPKPEPPKGE